MSNVISVPIGRGGAAVPVRLPKGRRDPSRVEVRALDDLAAAGKVRTGAGCMVFFVHKKGGGTQAIQRCEGSHLKAHNRKQCRNKKKKFVRCR